MKIRQTIFKAAKTTKENAEIEVEEKQTLNSASKAYSGLFLTLDIDAQRRTHNQTAHSVVYVQ